jgi:Spy/CpxP family protein refolding chaperone
MRDIRWMRGALPGLLLGVSLALVACDESSSGSGGAAATSSTGAQASASAAAAAAASASAAAAAQAEEHDKVDEASAMEDVRHFHRHHHHGGVMSFISMASETLGLDATKKAQVDKIRADLQAKMAPARDAEHDLLSTLADGIAAGKIDTAKVDAAVAKVSAASAQIHTATGDALTQLHDALSAQERQALVDKVKAHWEVWQKVNTGEKAGSTEKDSHLEHLTKMLSLTPDQVTKVTAALATEAPAKDSDPKPVDAYITAFATAFTADKFDPKALAAPATAAAGHMARFGGARMAHFYEALTPVLTPEQRTKLAAHLRERMNDHNTESSKPATPAPSASAAPAGSK